MIDPLGATIAMAITMLVCLIVFAVSTYNQFKD